MATEERDQNSAPNFVEVSREAHQLAASHGPSAHLYAMRLADKAEASGEKKGTVLARRICVLAA
jgi:hypothetical protein